MAFLIIQALEERTGFRLLAQRGNQDLPVLFGEGAQREEVGIGEQ